MSINVASTVRGAFSGDARPAGDAPRPSSAAASPTEALAPAAVRLLRLHEVDATEDAARLLAGLLAAQACSDPKFFYDAQGSALFDAICHLDEYHPTRIETSIFEAHRAEIARELPRGLQWVDLGAGDGGKARDWLAVVAASRYIGVDIAEAWLGPAVARIVDAHPGIDGVGAIADLSRPLALAPLLAERPAAPPLFFYPGSSIGNFEPLRAVALLKSLRLLGTGHGGLGGLLIGVDCERDAARLEAAYDDALGVTAAFNRNLLRVANRVLGADFDPRAWTHRAWFNVEESRIEMHLVAARDQTVRFVQPHRAERAFAAGEHIVTEYSYKYSPASFGKLLDDAGFQSHRLWQDPARRFAVFLAQA